MLGLDERQRLLARAGRLDLVAPLTDDPRQAIALRRFVVDHEDLSVPDMVTSGSHTCSCQRFCATCRLLTICLTPLACHASCSARARCSGLSTVPLRYTVP